MTVPDEPKFERDTREDADALEVVSTVTITDPEGNPLLVGPLVQTEAAPGPDLEVTATGEEYVPPPDSAG
jgi:hypothetical protein